MERTNERRGWVHREGKGRERKGSKGEEFSPSLRGCMDGVALCGLYGFVWFCVDWIGLMQMDGMAWHGWIDKREGQCENNERIIKEMAINKRKRTKAMLPSLVP